MLIKGPFSHGFPPYSSGNLFSVTPKASETLVRGAVFNDQLEDTADAHKGNFGWDGSSILIAIVWGLNGSLGKIPPNQKNQNVTISECKYIGLSLKQQQQQNELSKVSRFLNSLELAGYLWLFYINKMLDVKW